MIKLPKKRDHAELIYDVSELTDLFTDSSSLESFLQKIVELTAKHMHSDVCSIYLYYPERKELVLKATRGLNRDCINTIKLQLGEGLTGLSLKEMRPICERNASKNPYFRYFPGLGEEQFESFLSVPILRGTNMIGAMVIQNTKRDFFTEEDIKVLRAISSQMANTIEMTRLFFALNEPDQGVASLEPAKRLNFLKGRVGSGGCVMGPCVVLNEEKAFSHFQYHSFEKQYSLKAFQKAVAVTERQLEDIQEVVEETLSDLAALIFSAQILMLKDQGFVGRIESLIHDGANPPIAIMQTVKMYVDKFQGLSSAYLRERKQDVLDVGNRLLENLVGSQSSEQMYRNAIVIAEDVLPSEAIKLASQKVKGLVMIRGGVTSHASILAQSFGIPLVIVDVPELLDLPNGTQVLIDGDQGNVFIEPSKEVVQSYKDLLQPLQGTHKRHDKLPATTRTKDGFRLKIMANINLLGDIKLAKKNKSEGVGLYRTEIPFVVRTGFPTEEEQYVIYRKLVELLKNKPITFRTLDIGGDKVLSYFDHHAKEVNPYLGLRSIRFSLQHLDIFRQQIRAILRAGAGEDIRIMFPMISSLDEFIQARQITRECIKELKKEGAEFHSDPPIGMMIELPSTVEIIHELAAEADFFSIGTNDFIQYMLAVDRGNEKVGDLYIPHHPSVIRALKRIVDAGQKAGIEVSVCGDMAHDPLYLSIFIGMGIDTISVNPTYIPKLKMVTQSMHRQQAQMMMPDLLAASSTSSVMQILNQFVMPLLVEEGKDG